MKQKKFFLLIAVGGLAILSVMVIVVINIVVANSFSAAGERALKATEKLYRMAKVPSSFTLYSDVLYIDTSESSDYKGKEYIFIDYTAENSYGAALIGRAVFIDGEYYDREYQGPSRDEYDLSDYTQRDAYKAGLEDLVKVSDARLALLEYQLLLKSGIKNNSNIDSFELIPAEKIAAKLGISVR